MSLIQALTTMIQEQRICDPNTFADYELRIEDRYTTAFESAWVACFERLNILKLDEIQRRQLDILRETAFKAAYNATEDPDLAALVSDDFELIGKGTVISEPLSWLNGLWLSYRNGHFPSGEVIEEDGELAALVV